MYSERFSPYTNRFGLIDVMIGTGIVQSGIFEDIDWGQGPFFIQVEVDITGGESYVDMGTSQLLSVPYALYSTTAERLSVPPVESDPLFSASASGSITSTDITAWNNKLDTETDGSVTNELQVLSISNDTIYLSDGGFVEIPATSWLLNGNLSAGGSDFIGTINGVPLLFRVNNQKAGRLEPGTNLFFGYETGMSFSGGTYNTGIGYRTLNKTNGRSGNTALGSLALENNTSDRNTAVGFGTLQYNTTGQWNTALGSGALISNTSGSDNIAIGGVPLQNNLSGSANIAIGGGALLEHQSGNENIAIGMYSLKRNFNGINNVALGTQSGHNNISGSGNVFIGYKAGYNETGSDKLYIANRETGAPLIFGNFQTGTVSIGTTSPDMTLPLYVMGFENDGRIATFQSPRDEKLITVGDVAVDQGGYLKYKASSNYTGVGVHGHTEQVVITGTGNVGIGTTTPSSTLEVGGSLKLVDGTQGAGRILTSDENGLASWQTPESYSAGPGITISGNTISAKNDFYLGQDTLGGIVYYIYLDKNGTQHGLIVSKTETTAQWQSTISTTNANRSWDGVYNTNLMTDSPAKDWVTGNFSGEWYLPSIDELSLLWHNRYHANIGLNKAGATLLLLTNRYWSSTEWGSSDLFAYHFFFEYGYATGGGTNKATAMNVRAIRAF